MAELIAFEIKSQCDLSLMFLFCLHVKDTIFVDIDCYIIIDGISKLYKCQDLSFMT